MGLCRGWCNTVIGDRSRPIRPSSFLSKDTHKEKRRVSYLQPPAVARLMALLGRSRKGVIIPQRSVKVDAFLIHKVDHVLTKLLLLEHFLQSTNFPIVPRFFKKWVCLCVGGSFYPNGRIWNLLFQISVLKADIVAGLIITWGSKSCYVFSDPGEHSLLLLC